MSAHPYYQLSVTDLDRDGRGIERDPDAYASFRVPAVTPHDEAAVERIHVFMQEMRDFGFEKFELKFHAYENEMMACNGAVLWWDERQVEWSMTDDDECAEVLGAGFNYEKIAIVSRCTNCGHETRRGGWRTA